MPSPARKTVCVISEQQLQNQFIARLLETRDELSCMTAESPEEARLRYGDEYDRTPLFLWDCWNKDLAGAIAGIKDLDGALPKNSAVGLFNVGRRAWGNGVNLPRQVKGIFLVGISAEDFLKGVSCVLEGKSWLPSTKAALGPSGAGACIAEADSPREALTPREEAILSLIQQGKSNRQIADALGARYKTIKNHCNNMFRKLEVSNRLQAARRAKGR